mgnify:FL=1
MAKLGFTKETSPWLKAQQVKNSICTWCEGKIQESRTDYWECIVCGKYYEMS